MKNYRFDPYFKKGSRFINPHLKDMKRSLLDFAKWRFGSYKGGRKPPKIPDGFTYPNERKRVRDENPTATWINHCSFLIQMDGLHILTDPIWSDRCSPFRHIGPRRLHEPPMRLDELPPIDIVLISHDHYDHLDRKTVRKLHKMNPQTMWVVPHGMGKWMQKQGIEKFVELAWWEEASLEVEGTPPLKMKVTAVPAQHFSGRTLLDKNRTLWVGYVVEFERGRRKNKRLYFVGDTGYNNKDFKAIGHKFGEMDLSLIPIGTYVPGVFMDPVHIGPKKSAKIHQDVGSKLSIGMHWKTFRLSEEKLHQPPYDLYLALEKSNVDPKTFRVLDPGQRINW